jgi:predicted nucleotidyltransferase component of viral defense system
MMTLREQVNLLVGLGYKRLAAQAKVAHDVVLLAMHKSGFKAKSTIKGGVVMSSITHDIRRATMDMDIDFVHHSISKRSIELFVRGLNRAVEGIDIAIAGPIVDLKHEDYRGKRIFVTVTDSTTSRPLRTKIDVGVHTHDEMAQLEYSFEVVSSDEKAELQVNSNEQIFVEKLLSLLRHGIVSRRPKDVFDMYYLSSRVDLGVVRSYMSSLVYASTRCRERTKEDVLGSLQRTFSSKRYLSKLGSARVNWLGVSPKIAINAVIKLIASL